MILPGGKMSGNRKPQAVIEKVNRYSQNRTKAEVIVRLGNKRVTRHLQKNKNGVWSGYDFERKAIIVYKLDS